MPTLDQGRKQGGLFGLLGGDEYEVVPITPSWGTLSLGFFVLALMARPVVRLFVGWSPDRPYLLPLLMGVATPVVGLIGLLFGWLGWRRSSSKVIARVGMFLNGTIVLLTVLLIAVFMIGRYFR